MGAIEGRRRGERGSSLIEVVLVVTVLGALPVAGFGWRAFVRDRAADRSAQVELRAAVLTVGVVRADPAASDVVDAGALSAAEPGLRFVADDPGPHEVAVRTDPRGTSLRVRSATGRCFAALVDPTGQVQADPTSPDCEGLSGSSRGSAPPRSPLG